MVVLVVPIGFTAIDNGSQLIVLEHLTSADSVSRLGVLGAMCPNAFPGEHPCLEPISENDGVATNKHDLYHFIVKMKDCSKVIQSKFKLFSIQQELESML
ncbi:hypothetical protein Tco_1167504 [Tanacetum coccineum]